MITTQPVARQQINVAPAAPVAATTMFDVTQWHAIDAAVQSSLAGIQSGNTVGNFANLFETKLLATPGANPNGSVVTSAQANQLGQAYEQVASGGNVNFRDQGNSATPFINAWTAGLHSLFGSTADPVAAIAAPTPAAAAAAPIAAPPILTPAAAAPASTAAAVAATIPSDPISVQSITAAITAAIAAGTAATPAATSTSSALQTTTDGTSATTATSPISDATTAALISALSGGGSSTGLTSTDMSAGVPSTGGIQQITPVAAPTSTTSNPTITYLAIGAVAIGGVALYLKLHKHQPSTSTTPAAT